jgi:hypothetical protein
MEAEGRATLHAIRTEYALANRSFEDTTQRKKGDPWAQPLLIEALFSGDSAESLFEGSGCRLLMPLLAFSFLRVAT